MKILFLALNDKGGMIQYVNQLIKSFPGDIQIVSISGNSEKTNFKNIKKYCISLKKIDFLKTLLIIRNIVISENPDIIHIISPHWYYLFLRFTLKKWPLVFTSHDIHPHTGENSFISQFLINQLVNDANHIFVHGQNLQEELIQSAYLGKRYQSFLMGIMLFFRLFG